MPTLAAITTVAGDGTEGYQDDDIGTNAQFNYPQGITLDAAGNLYVADTENHRIRKISPAGKVTAFAGGTSFVDAATGNTERFGVPRDLAIDAAGDFYVADSNSYRIWKIVLE